MRLFNWIFALAIVGSASLAFADNGDYDNGNNGNASSGLSFCCEDSGFYVYGDVLYWEACKSDADYSNSGTKYLNLDHDVGFRIGGQFVCDCKDIGIRYTSWDSSDHIVDGGDRSYALDFEVVDIEFGYRLRIDCVDAELRPFIGAKLAWLDETLHFDGSDHHKIDTDAYGLYLGSEFLWSFYDATYCGTCYPLSLLARVSWGVLDSDINHSTTDGDTFEKHCLYIHAFEAFVGVDFTVCICDCFEMDVLLGYEIQKWMGMRRLGSSDDLSSLGMSGMTMRFGASF